MMTTQEAADHAIEATRTIVELCTARRAFPAGPGAPPPEWAASRELMWTRITALIEAGYEDTAIDLARSALNADLHRGAGACAVALARLNPVLVAKGIKRSPAPVLPLLPKTAPLGAILECAVVPKALLAELMIAARLTAEAHDAAKQPPEYIEARLLRAVEAIETLGR